MQDKEVVKKIKNWRWRIAKAGLKQYEFCAMVEVSESNMSLYLKAKKSPRALTIEKIESKLLELGV